MIYCGIDWADKTHDIALVDADGRLLAARRITDDAAGYQRLLHLLAEYGDTRDAPIPVAIETSRGLLLAVLRTGARQVFAIDPTAAARHRTRHTVAHEKSDHGDAVVLAHILRTDMHTLRPLSTDSEPARAVAVLARAQQDATWHRQQISHQLRSLLRDYYPAALAAAAHGPNGIFRPEARELLKAAPTPARAARLTRTQITAALKRAGRRRGIEAEVERLRAVFRAEWAHQPPLVEEALGRQTLALLLQLAAACTAADDLAQALAKAVALQADAPDAHDGAGMAVGSSAPAPRAADR